MNRQRALSFLVLALLYIQVSGQTFKQQFNDLFSRKDTVGQQQLLEKWELADSDDPELYVAYFNYYVTKSKREVIRLGQDPKGDQVLQLMDQDTSKKDPVGFMYSDTYYDPETLSKGFDWINKGIEKNPNRLDMRFGRIHMLGKSEDYEQFTQRIIETIDRSAVNSKRPVNHVL